MFKKKYTDFNKMTEKFNIITSYSYEDRIIKSTKRILKKFNINNAYIIKYDGDQFLSKTILKKWGKNQKTIDNMLKINNVSKKIFDCRHDVEDDLNNILFNIETNDNIVIDITGLTKNYILKIAYLLENYNTYYFYTRKKGDRVPNKNELLVSINKIVPVREFEGYISLNKQDLVVLTLGYEGNRSLAFLKKYETEPILALIGHPHYKDETINNIYIDSIIKANNQLLNVHRVLLNKTYLHSLDPFEYSKDIEDAINTYPNIENYNICISNLGTKLQTLGLYLYWKKNPTVQIVYSIPNKRFELGSGYGDSTIFKINDCQNISR